MASFAETIAQYADQDPLDPNTFLQQMWPQLSPSQQELFSSMLAQRQNVRRDVAVQGGQGQLMDAMSTADKNNPIKKKDEVQKPIAGAPAPAWSPESIIGMQQASKPADIEAGFKADAGRIPTGVYNSSNDPMKANVVSHTLPNGQKQNVYLRDTAANIQEDISRRMAVSAINAQNVQQAGVGLAAGTQIKLRNGEWITVGGDATPPAAVIPTSAAASPPTTKASVTDPRSNPDGPIDWSPAGQSARQAEISSGSFRDNADGSSAWVPKTR